MDVYNWRRELIQALLARGCRVHLALPWGEMLDPLIAGGCDFTDIQIDRRGKNPFKDLKLIFRYIQLLRKEKPDYVLTYGTKPNIYGGLVCRMLHISCLENINGLGSGIAKGKGLMEKMIQRLIKSASKRAKCVFFQNASDRAYCLKNRIVTGYNRLIPGSGVNLSFFGVLPFPGESPVVFTFIARIMQEKGIDEFLAAAKNLRETLGNAVEFCVLGFCEEAYESRLKEYEDKGYIRYFGMQKDVRPFIEKSHCIVMPSYYGEGMSNSLLESAASGRAIVTTGLPGCAEIVDDGVTGFVVEPKNADSLIRVLNRFLSMNNEDRRAMGLAGRQKMEREFDRNIVVNAYLEELKETE